jgi:hypothetical protein
MKNASLLLRIIIDHYLRSDLYTKNIVEYAHTHLYRN